MEEKNSNIKNCPLIEPEKRQQDYYINGISYAGDFLLKNSEGYDLIVDPQKEKMVHYEVEGLNSAAETA